MRVAFAIQCHDAEYVQELDEMLEPYDQQDGDNLKYATLEGVPAIISIQNFDSLEPVAAERKRLADQYNMTADSIVVLHLY